MPQLLVSVAAYADMALALKRIKDDAAKVTVLVSATILALERARGR